MKSYLIFISVLIISISVNAQNTYNEQSYYKGYRDIDSIIKMSHCKANNTIEIKDTSLVPIIEGVKFDRLKFANCQKVTKISAFAANKYKEMDLKEIEMYFVSDSLIKVTRYYDKDKDEYFRSFYYRGDEEIFNMTAGVSVLYQDDRQKYISISKSILGFFKRIRK